MLKIINARKRLSFLSTRAHCLLAILMASCTAQTGAGRPVSIPDARCVGQWSGSVTTEEGKALSVSLCSNQVSNSPMFIREMTISYDEGIVALVAINTIDRNKETAEITICTGDNATTTVSRCSLENIEKGLEYVAVFPDTGRTMWKEFWLESGALVINTAYPLPGTEKAWFGTITFNKN
jgi:hypothetical protein